MCPGECVLSLCESGETWEVMLVSYVCVCVQGKKSREIERKKKSEMEEKGVVYPVLEMWVYWFGVGECHFQ